VKVYYRQSADGSGVWKTYNFKNKYKVTIKYNQDSYIGSFYYAYVEYQN